MGISGCKVLRTLDRPGSALYKDVRLALANLEMTSAVFTNTKLWLTVSFHIILKNRNMNFKALSHINPHAFPVLN